MKQKIKRVFSKDFWRRENTGIILVALVGLWVAYQTLFVVLKNNQLLAGINEVSEEVALAELEQENLGLSIEYYKTDEYVGLSARENLLLREPGEHVAIAPKTREATFKPAESRASPTQSSQKSNFQAWLDFLSGGE